MGKLHSQRSIFLKLLSSRWLLISLIFMGAIIIWVTGIFILPYIQKPVIFNHSSRISKSVNKFSSNKVLQYENKNLVFSPFGAWTTLLFVASEGTNGNTTKQLLSSIYSNGSQIERNEANDLIQILNVTQNVPLKLGVKVFVNSKIRIEEAYENYMRENYKIGVQSVNFSRPHRTSKTINDWVDYHTDIFSAHKDTVCPSQLSSSINIVIVNSVGTWMTNFNGALTTFRPFHLQNGKNISVQTMQVFGSFKYGTIPDIPAKIIELPYKRENTNDLLSMSMFVIIPDDGSNLQDIESNLSELDLSHSFKGTNTDLEFYIPTFEQDSNIDLNGLNMAEVFSHFKYFSENFTMSPVRIDKIVQRSSIKVQVDRKGGADIANIIRMGSHDHSLKRTILHVDHPFLIFIRTEDIALFSIRVVDPSRDTDVNKFGCPSSVDFSRSKSSTPLVIDGILISNSSLLQSETLANPQIQNPEKTTTSKIDETQKNIKTSHQQEFK